jgi:hypothetical protein
MHHDERAELIAAALAGELSEAERRRLDALRAKDPSIDVELADLGAVASDLTAIGWDDARAGDRLRDRVLGLGEARAAAPVKPRRARRTIAIVVAAAACVALGSLVTVTVQSIADQPVAGPPGTLGALEPITFQTESAIRIDAALVAHTWGTETVLEIDGSTVGAEYAVRLVDDTGTAVSSGSFIGSAATVDCRMNAALQRGDLATVQITDSAGTVLASAEVPAVG